MALKPKNLPQSSGAEDLAAMMAGLDHEPGGKPLKQIPLAELHDAPEDWNFFAPLSDGKFFELLESMREKGVLVPLIVWEREQGGYMILSGHNRKRAAAALFERTADSRFSSLPCRVYRSVEIDEQQARGILIDCNWVQRTLTPAERAKAIRFKYVELGRQTRGSGKRSYDLVAEHFGLKATQVYQYYKLAALEDEWLQKLDGGEISLKAGAHLAKLNANQRETLLKISGALTNADIFKIRPEWTSAQIREYRRVPEQQQQLRELRIMVPAARYDEILKALETLLDSDHDLG